VPRHLPPRRRRRDGRQGGAGPAHARGTGGAAGVAAGAVAGGERGDDCQVLLNPGVAFEGLFCCDVSCMGSDRTVADLNQCDLIYQCDLGELWLNRDNIWHHLSHLSPPQV